MKREHFDQMLAKASKSVQALNRELARVCPTPVEPTFGQPLVVPKKRIRQSSKPLMNKLETEWFSKLERRHGVGSVKVQARKYKLANGCWYCPDFSVSKHLFGKVKIECCYEVKGPHSWDDAMVKLKVAAHEWPDVEFVLVWKQDGFWQEQIVIA